jgi:PIN domain nuclease of toxin-antitoxin system
MIVLDTHIWHWWTNQIKGKLSSRTRWLLDQPGVDSMMLCLDEAPVATS